MKALCWHGKNDIRCDSVPDPKIEDARDVIIKVTSCAICGSDLHLMDGMMPTMESGDILGHEFMGEVVETGSPNHKFKKGDRIVERQGRLLHPVAVRLAHARVRLAEVRCALPGRGIRRRCTSPWSTLM